MSCVDCIGGAKDEKGCPSDQVQGYAIFDTETDRYCTSCWSWRMCEKILRMWERKGRNLLRFEIRPRDYGETADNRAVLLIGRSDNLIHAFYHWDNRGYALSYDSSVVFPVLFSPTNGVDITDIQKRFDRQPWDGKGSKITFEALRR